MHQRTVLLVFRDNVLLFLAYYLSGHLSLSFLATSPSSAAAIWPPAGISLAAALVRGYHVLPAVFIGDLIIALELSGFSGFVPIAFSMAVGFQAFMSAFLGVFLISGILGKDNPLLDNRSILRFFLIAGPLSQIFFALIAVGVQYWLGMLHAVDILPESTVWWVGNSIGVILFAPLTLVVISPYRATWQPRFVSVFLPMIFLCIAGVYVFNKIRTDEQERLKTQFDRTASLIHQQVVEEGRELADEGDQLKMFVQTSAGLSSYGFGLFSQTILSRHEEIVALTWLTSPSLHLEKNQQSVEAQYIVPSSARKTIGAFVSSAGGEWDKTLARAIYFSRSELIGPLQVPAVSSHFQLAALVQPIGSGEKNRDTAKAANAQGFIVVIFDYERVRQEIIDFADHYEVGLEIVDGLVHDGGKSESTETETGFDFSRITPVSVLGHSGTFIYKPTEDFINSHLPFSYWGIFIAGFSVIGLFEFVLLSVTGQTLQTQRLVNIRTEELSSERRLLESILNNISEGIVAFDRKGRITMLNRTARERYGLEIINVSPRKWAEQYQLFDAGGNEHLNLMKNPLFQALTGKTVNAFEIMMKKTRNPILLSVNSQPIRSESGKIVGAVASFQDITEQKRNAVELKKLSLAVRHSPSAIMIADTAGRIEYVNDKFVEMTGYSKGEMIGRTPSVLKSGRTGDEIYKELWEALLNGRDWRGEILNQKKNGDFYWTRQFISPVRNEEGKLTHYVSISEDVTEIRRRTEKMVYQARHDDLTRLLNRWELEDRLQRVLEDCRSNDSRHVFCFLDLDRFKTVNDSCGHLAGDQLLRDVAGILNNMTRGRDTLARLGGDEFGLIMEDCGLETAGKIAKRICLEIAGHNFQWQKHRFSIGVSIGITEINRDCVNHATILEQAYQACYRVKQQGGGQVAVYENNDSEQL